MVQPNENIANRNICYRSMALSDHCPEAVANLIYTSAPEMFALLFGAQAIDYLADFVRRPNNRFSHRYIRVAEIGDRVVGMVVLVPAADLSDRADEDKVFGLGRKLWLKVVHFLLLRYVLKHDYPTGSFYIGNLAVAAEYRNQGIGRQLLSNCMAEVKSMAEVEEITEAKKITKVKNIVEGATHAEAPSTNIFISVDVSNTRAQKLYESLGFRVMTEKTIQLLGKTIGSRVLYLSL